MGFRLISLKLPTDYSEEELKRTISRELGIRDFSYTLEGKSLDARKKSDIHWLLRVGVSSDALKGGDELVQASLDIPRKKRNQKVLITGTGPAGFFAALLLQKAGFSTILIDRGMDVDKRSKGIEDFERGGTFDPMANYAFGEGGAGTFSDGKLTSRSKHISLERDFILQSYIRAGAPPEIAYMTHPHLGSDGLRSIVKNLRQEYESLGGKIQFETTLIDLVIEDGIVKMAICENESISADYFIIAPGHSAYETYRMLIRRGVAFHPKNFAIGSRMEHPQELINTAQWGKPSLPGVKAAEYRLTSTSSTNTAVYTFCMCPGGIVVPATPYANTSIVNGMSQYKRDLPFANAACVAGLNPNELLGEDVSALEVLDWLENLEMSFFNYSAYSAPFCGISDFIKKKETHKIPKSSYPLGLVPAPLWELLPASVSSSMRDGLRDFSRKIRGFETGIIMGLESKTSAPIQTVRSDDRSCTGIGNLFLAGEGSGFAGGIISSAADGVKTALAICGRD
ncbi:MAG: FAD-dependent monooxygenase [Bacteroidales bacterium]|nr:FAD-dependent monooxygenase [Bacteroidales bacterium]